MIRRTLIGALTLAAVAATPATAATNEPFVAPNSGGQSLTALDGTLVWVTGVYPEQSLVQRTPDGVVAPVAGARTAIYRSIDLGHDDAGRLVLTYLRCSDEQRCAPYSDDLAGHRVSYRRLVPKRCKITSVPARWGSRVAYGLRCDKLHGDPHRYDGSRSGLFARKGAGAARRLRLPKDADQFVPYVDLRGTTVGAVATTYANAFTQTVNGTHLRSARVADAAATSNGSITGMALGNSGRLWTVYNDIGLGSGPGLALISRLGNTSCVDSQRVPTLNSFGNRVSATAMAVDGDTLYLATLDGGIVTQRFAPTSVCP